MLCSTLISLFMVLGAQNAVATPRCCKKFEQQHQAELADDCSSCSWDALVQAYPSNTSTIDLCCRKLKSIPPDAFARFPNLQKLFLHSNPLSHIDADAFRGLQKLRFLQIDSYTTNLTEPFSQIPQLNELHIKVFTKTYPHDSIASLTNLTKLVTTAPYYQPFGPQFKSLTRLRALHIYKGYLTLQSDTFEAFRNAPLETLALQSLGKIFNVSHLAFSPFAMLENLLICNLKSKNPSTDLLLSVMAAVEQIPSNRLKTLSVDCVRTKSQILSKFTFDSISTDTPPFNNIERMNFRSNMVGKVGLGSLIGLLNLTYLSLDQMFALYWATENVTQFMENIETTKLSHLDLSGVSSARPVCSNLKPQCSPNNEPDDLFPTKEDLFHNFIPESNNSIESPLPLEDFEELLKATKDSKDDLDYKSRLLYFCLLHKMRTALVKQSSFIYQLFEYPLSIRNSRLRYLDVSFNRVNDYFHTAWNFSDFTSLTFLNFSHAGLNSLPADLASLTELTTLDLSHNNLKTTSFNDIFTKMTKLKHLLLSRNSVATFPRDLFTSLRSLKQLWLNENNILLADFQLPLTKSLAVNMNDNRISWFTKTFTDSVDELINGNCNISIDATDNMFQCTCQTMAFIKWLQSTPAWVKDRHSYICSNNNQRVTANTQRLQGECHLNSKGLRIGAIIVPIMSVLVLIAIVWCYCNPWTVRWYMYKVKQHIPCTEAYSKKREEELLLENKEYDVAVIYDTEDSKYNQWITETLIPILLEWNLRVFCVDDQKKGESIASILIKLADSCSHFLFVITPQFAERSLCLFALHMVLPSHLENLVFIDLETLTKREMAYSNVLVKVKAISPTIAYPQQIEELPAFWKKLNKTLVHRTNENFC